MVNRKSRPRRGSALVLMIFMFAMFFVFAAYTINISKMQCSRVELQIASDAASLAAAEAYARTDSESAAIEAGIEMAAKNLVDGNPVRLTASHFTFGKSMSNGNGGFDFMDGSKPYTAVKVDLSEEVSLFFGKITGVPNFQPISNSVSKFGGHDIILCIDKSASMAFDYTGNSWSYPNGARPHNWWKGYNIKPDKNNSRWAGLVKGVDQFLNVVEMREFNPQTGLITFSGYEKKNGDRIPASTDVKLGQPKNNIRGKLNQLSNKPLIGGTNTAEGLRKSIDEITSSRAKTYSAKTIILFSDGRTTQGSSPKFEAERARDNNVVVHTISLLTGTNPEFEEIAKITGGESFYATNEEELTKVFDELAKKVPVVLTQ